MNKQKFNKLVKAKEGFCLYNKNDIYVGRSIENYGEFSQLEVELFSQICQEDDTIIEVGANIGTHTQYFSNKVGEKGKVLAFEPQRIVFQTLCANIAINSMTNVYTYQMALGNEEKTILIPPLDYLKNGNFGGVSVDGFKNGEPVVQKKLDSFIDELNKVKFIKIDVEGMEKEVLKGSKKLIEKFKPILYLENDRQEKSHSLIDYIKELEYELYWHLPRLYNPKNFYNNQNNIFGNIVSVNMLCIPKSSKIKVDKMQKIEDSSFHPMRKISEERR